MTLLTADTNLQLKWTILHSSSCSLQLSKHSVVPDNNNYYHMTESLYTFTKYSRTFQNVETSLWYAFQHDCGTVAISRYLSSQLLFITSRRVDWVYFPISDYSIPFDHLFHSFHIFRYDMLLKWPTISSRFLSDLMCFQYDAIFRLKQWKLLEEDHWCL